MEHKSMHSLANQMIDLLCKLIEQPSFSKEEHITADIIFPFLEKEGANPIRFNNNVVAKTRYYNPAKPTLLLNSHHDTVKPNTGYVRNPFEARIEEGKLYGLGSNDAGGALVALLATFLYFYNSEELSCNIVFAATAEEEISGRNGIESIIPDLGKIDIAIVGEPTQMKMAIAERGLMVLDCEAKGGAGHVANNIGVNAIYQAIEDIEWFKNFNFEKTSEWLGSVNMNITVINAGTAHNQIPASCSFVVDVRLNECYTHQEILDIIQQHVKSNVKERSTRIKPSYIEHTHPMVEAATQLGIQLFGSSTTSDMALMPWKAVKIGPGDTKRSHSADEYIYIEEIEKGIELYIDLINAYSKKLTT